MTTAKASEQLVREIGCVVFDDDRPKNHGAGSVFKYTLHRGELVAYDATAEEPCMESRVDADGQPRRCDAVPGTDRIYRKRARITGTVTK